jgi:multisubunit Na+/H+ antiporter MnhB subunit
LPPDRRARQLAAVIGFVVYGLLLWLVWVRLWAVDVALTEAAVGSGVTGMLLIGAAVRLRDTEASAVEASLSLRVVAGVICALVSAGLAALVLFPPEIKATLAPQVMAHLAESGLGNPVAGVLFVYRAFDTLLEKVVLILALVGVWSLAPDRLWGGIPGLRLFTQPGSVLVFLAQVLPPIGIVAAIYMFWVGAIFREALSGRGNPRRHVASVMIAGLRDVPATSRRSLRLLAIVGPVVFLRSGLRFFVGAPSSRIRPDLPLIILIEVPLTLDRRHARPADGGPWSKDPDDERNIAFGYAPQRVGLGLYGLIRTPAAAQDPVIQRPKHVFRSSGSLPPRCRRRARWRPCHRQWSLPASSLPSQPPQLPLRCSCGCSGTGQATLAPIRPMKRRRREDA